MLNCFSCFITGAYQEPNKICFNTFKYNTFLSFFQMSVAFGGFVYYLTKKGQGRGDWVKRNISPLHLGVCPGEAGSVPVLSWHEQEKEPSPCSVQLAAKPRPHISCRQHIVSSGNDIKRDTVTTSMGLGSSSMRSGYIKCVKLKCEIHVWQVWDKRSGTWSWGSMYLKHDLQKPQAWNSSTPSMKYQKIKAWHWSTPSMIYKNHKREIEVPHAWDQSPWSMRSKYVQHYETLLS